MRTLNSLKNVIGNFANTLFLNVLRFVSRIIFVKILGELYLGVNGLLSNVLGLLALSELGIGTAISYSLYKPLEQNDENKIKSLMKFYKKAYFIIAIVVLVSGLILLPFLPWLIKDPTGIDNLSIIYLIFLANMVIGYLFSYKRTLIIADQKNYKIMPFLMLFNFITTIGQIIILIVLKNYIAYLLVQTVCILLENIFVNRYIDKEYPLLSTLNDSENLDKEEFNSIFINIKALMMHKIGGYVFTSTDNLVMSKFIGLAVVGIYSNYVLIVNMINSFISTLTNSVVASLGNLIAAKDIEKKYKVFNEMNFICFVLYGISTIGFIALFTPFISLCFGEKFLLSMPVVLLISFNNYIYGMSSVSITFQNASGLYENDKYIPLVQSVVNLIISILLAIKIGVAGVLIGTLISNIFPLIIKPYIIYKNVFNKNLKVYIGDFLGKGLVLGLILLIVTGLIYIVPISNLIVAIVYRLLVVLIVSGVVLLLVYGKSEVFQSIFGRVKHILSSIIKKA